MLKIDEATAAEREPLDTRVPPHVRIINGALDEDPASPGVIILQGRVDPNTLRFLNVDHSYQRPLGDRKDIYEALKSGTVVPNIEVGVRDTYRITNLILAAFTAAIWTAAFLSWPSASAVEAEAERFVPARYCVVPGTNMAALCRDVPAEIEV